MAEPTKLPAWQALQEHQREIAGVHMRDLFAHDPQRLECFSLQLGDILFDYSKNRITLKTMALLPGNHDQSADGQRMVLDRGQR
ncbi:MAG TPA: hypothetical protein VIO36_06600 [Anaerolineaceae bacterium]